MDSNRFPLLWFNPLNGLDEYRLSEYLWESERGMHARPQWLYRSIEKRNPIARAVRRRLLSAIGRLHWKIKVADAQDDPARQALADAQAATLRTAYDRITNLQRALQHLAAAELRGFAHVEKIYGAGLPTVTSHQSPVTPGSEPAAPVTGDPASVTELRAVPQWFWVRDGLYGDWQYNRWGTMGAFRGEPVDLSRFIVREVDDPLHEIIAKCHVRMEASDSDWDGFLESYGIPATIIEGPPNVPQEKELEYQRQAEGISSDARGYIPNGAKVHNIAPATGDSAHKERLDWLASQIVLAATSGKLTMLTESGSGSLAGGAHTDSFDEIAQAIAADLSMTMQDQFDRPLLAHAHPDEPVLAYFEFGPVDETDAGRVLDDAVKAKNAGFEMDPDELSELSGYKLKRAAAQPNGLTAEAQNIGTLSGEGLPQPEITARKAAQTMPTPDDTGPVTIHHSPVTPPASAVTPQNLSDATAAQLGVTPDYLAPVAQTFAALIASAQDGAISNDEFIASAEEMVKKLPLLAKMMDSTGIATALAAAMDNAAAEAVQPA